MIRVGLIGCGRMGARHAAAIAAHPDCTLVWVDDIDPARARDLAARTHASPTPQGQVDAVVVATPPQVRHPAREAAASGRWVFVEKPLALSTGEGASLDRPQVFVGLVERFNPALRAAGPLSPRHLDLVRQSPPPERGQEVPVAFDLLVHDLDLALLWDPDLRLRSGRAVGERAWCALTGPRLTAELRVDRAAPSRRRRLVAYEARAVTTLDLLRGVARRDGATLPGAPTDALQAQWAAFVDAVCGRPSPIATARDALAGLALAEQIPRGA